jgi:hypothetical protein
MTMPSKDFDVTVVRRGLCSRGGSFNDASYIVAGDLAGGGADAVERVDRRNRNHQGR